MVLAKFILLGDLLNDVPVIVSATVEHVIGSQALENGVLMSTFFAAVDSKSLYNALNKCSSTVAFASDKRTAIDLSVIKSNLADTCGQARWIDTRSMISDPLTKVHSGDYLRHVVCTGLWSVEEGRALQQKPWKEKEIGVTQRTVFGLKMDNWKKTAKTWIRHHSSSKRKLSILVHLLTALIFIASLPNRALQQDKSILRSEIVENQ